MRIPVTGTHYGIFTGANLKRIYGCTYHELSLKYKYIIHVNTRSKGVVRTLVNDQTPFGILGNIFNLNPLHSPTKCLLEII